MLLPPRSKEGARLLHPALEKDQLGKASAGSLTGNSGEADLQEQAAQQAVPPAQRTLRV